MKINDMHIPETLLDAIKSDSLVVFAGAGVSMGVPARLPDFETLCKQISKQSKFNLDNNQKKECDRFLGMIHSLENVDVHKLACEYLKNGNECNEIHKLIADIFKNKIVRIITTNYDHLFENYFNQTNIRIKVYNNPALPYGDKFDGLVHIHGNINDPDNMVLTDEDFGKAYMSKGQVSRFLIDVFENYNVLFIGYSYNDTIMKYLTRAMFNKNSKYGRYILTSDKTNNWSLYKIEPIFYEEKNFEQLNKIISEIARISSTSYSDWKIQAEMISKAPKDMDSYDYLKYNLKDTSKMKIFIDKARFDDWISWFNDYGYLDNLFNSKNKTYSDSDIVLCDWISKNCLENLDEIKKIYNTHKFEISDYLKRSILRELAINDEEINKNIYIELIAMLNIDRSIDDYVGIKLIEKLCELDLKGIALNVFIVMLTPKYIPINDNFINDDNYVLKHNFGIDSYDVEELYTKFGSKFSDQNGIFICKLISILENIYLYSCSSKKNPNSGFHYTRINVSTSDDIYYKEDTLYYICEMIIDNFGIIYKFNQRKIIEKCVKSKFIILNMLGIVLLKEATAYTANQKIELLLKMDIDWMINKEYIFKLVAAIFDDLTDKVRDKFIKYISKGINNKDKVYEVYNWYVWLINNCKKVESIINVKNEIESKYSFVPREHPELNFYVGKAQWIDNIIPFSREEIEKMSIDIVIEKINTFKQEKFISSYTREGFLTELVKVLIKDYHDIISLLDKRNEIDIESDFWEYFYSELRNLNCSNNVFFKIMEKIYAEHLKSYGMQLLRFILSIIKNNDISFEDEKKICGIIKQIYLSSGIVYDLKNDITSVYLNSSAGTIMECYFTLISKNNSFNDEYKKLFVELINVNNQNKYIYAFGIVGRISYFFNNDREWCINNIAHYFESNDDEMFKSVWSGLSLFNGKMSYDFAYFMKEYFSKASSRITLFDSQTRYIFLWKLVMIILYIDDNPLELIYKVINSSNDDIIEEFYGMLQEQLIKYKDAKGFYEKVLKILFDDRISRSDKLEYNKIISFAFVFEEMCDEILKKVIHNNRKIDVSWQVLYNIEECGFLNYKYSIIIDFLRMLSHNDNIDESYHLRNIINKIRLIENVEKSHLQDITEIELKYDL